MTVVLGGGISGLAAAYYALENRLGALTLLEASNRVGGWIRSCQSPNGSVFEKGPRTIRPSGPAGKHTLEIVEKLRLTDKLVIIPQSHPAAKMRYLYTNDKLCLMPNSIGSLFSIRPPFRRPLITVFWNDWRAPQLKADDESLYSFVSRRLGTDIADYIISPMTCGIAAGDAQKLSVHFLMPTFYEGEQKFGSIFKGIIFRGKESGAEMSKTFKEETLAKIQEETERKKRKTENDRIEVIDKLSSKGITQMKDFKIKDNRRIEDMPTLADRAKLDKWFVWTLNGGLEQIPQRLKDYLEINNVNIRLNTACERIMFKPDGVEVQVNGEVQTYSKVVSSLPAKHLAPLVQQQHPELADELKAIPFVTVAVVNIEFTDNVIPVDAFGFLVPPKENLPILGVIFDSCILSQKSPTVLTVMMGGAWFEHHFGKDPTEDHLLSVALEHVKNILNISADPANVHVSILKDCIPQHVVGHKQRVERIRNYIASNGLPLALCGSSYQGVGINDVILSAKNAIDDIS